jgi:hypothetical protein
MRGSRCLWCRKQYTPRRSGGRAQRFCTPRCRRAFDAALRAWTLAELVAGRVTVGMMRNALTTTRAVVTAAIEPRGASRHGSDAAATPAKLP